MHGNVSRPVRVGADARCDCWRDERERDVDIGTLAVVAVVIGLLPAAIAQSKGESFLLWWIYGAAFFIVALPHALVLAPTRTCPFCAEGIKPGAVVCPHCQRDLPAESPPPNQSSSGEAYWP